MAKSKCCDCTHLFEPKKTEAVCNLCGKSCRKEISIPVGSKKKTFMGLYGLIDAEFSGGYHSEGTIADRTLYRFTLCESCLGKLFKRFKVPVQEYCLLDDGEALKAGVCPLCEQKAWMYPAAWERLVRELAESLVRKEKKV